MFYRTNLNVVQSIPNRDPGCSEAYIKDPEHGASTGSWLYVPEARAVSCDMNWPLSMNPGSRKKLQCIHDPSLIGLFNYILLRKLKLIKILHDIDETGTGPSMAPCCIFYFLEASPTRTQRVRTLFLSSLSRRELPPLPNLKFSIFANSSATRHKMTLITSTLGRPPGYSVDS